jgi:hypothetical protein
MTRGFNTAHVEHATSVNTADVCAYMYGVNDGTWRQDPFSDVESDEDSEIEMLECAEDAEMDEDEDDDDDDEDDEAGAAGGKRAQQVWIPGKGGEQPEHLEVDNSTYEMLHRMNVEWPMLRYARNSRYFLPLY